MPLFRPLGEPGGCRVKAQPRRKRMRNTGWMGSCGRTDEDGSVLSLTRLCLLSLADNMKEVWVKDYADNYLDHYSFRYIMGPFNLLPSDLVEELTCLLCTRRQLSRAALHLLLVPQLRNLSLEKCTGLVTSALCSHIAARCEGLRSLDLSGAQQLPSKVLSETLSSLPALRFLSLAGTPCDRCVIRTIALRCRLLRHLDVSRCHFLSPAALLPLGCGAPSHPAPFSPPPLISLLALDIGFGEHEEDPVASAAYLLLSLPCLERVAMEGLTQACHLIQHRDFEQTNAFADREEVPRLGEMWEEWRHRHKQIKEETDEEDEDEERMLWEEYGNESEEGAIKGEGPSGSQDQAEEHRRARSQPHDKHLILRLKDVKGLSCVSLDSLSNLCPNIYSIALNLDGYEDAGGRSRGSLLAAGLQAWSGQLRSLSIQYSGPLVDLLPALKIVGSSLLSLSLEGVKTSPHTPLLKVIQACPRLRDMLISAEPPTMLQEQEDEVVQWNRRNNQDLPQLPNLCSLTLRFSYEHSQMKPFMSWISLMRVLKCLLTGSPLLEKISLVSLPCPLNGVLQYVLRAADLPAVSTDSTPKPLSQVRHIDLARTDVRMITVNSLMQRSNRLKCVDVSHCWQISQVDWMSCTGKIQVLWQ